MSVVDLSTDKKLIQAVREFLDAPVWNKTWEPCRDHFNPCRGEACCEFGAKYDALDLAFKEYSTKKEKKKTTPTLNDLVSQWTNTRPPEEDALDYTDDKGACIYCGQVKKLD